MWAIIKSFFGGFDPLMLVAIIAAVGMMTTIWYQGNRIDSLKIDVARYEDRIKTIQDEKDNLVNAISEQNKSIEEAHKKFLALEGSLSKVQEDNSKLRVLNEKLKVDLAGKPLPVTCQDAVTELRETMNNIADKWNSK